MNINSLIGIKKVIDKPVTDKRVGICVNYVVLNIAYKEEFKTLVIAACINLGIYSGVHDYPIASDTNQFSAFDKYQFTINLWDEQTDYGQRRHNVLNEMRRIINTKLFEALKDLPQQELLDLYDAQSDESIQTFIEDVMHEYHFCDVCDAHYPIDEPCRFH